MLLSTTLTSARYGANLWRATEPRGTGAQETRAQDPCHLAHIPAPHLLAACPLDKLLPLPLLQFLPLYYGDSKAVRTQLGDREELCHAAWHLAAQEPSVPSSDPHLL